MAKVVKGKKKKWHGIVAPELFKGVSLGESYVYDISNLIGKKLRVNLGSLRFDKKQNVRIIFRITDVKENNAYTELIGYEVYGAYLKRLIRVGNRKVESSSLYESKDNIKLKIKLFLVTRGKPPNAVLTALREDTQKFLKEYLKEKSYNDFMKDVLFSNLHKSIKNKLKKIYPVVSFEFSKIIKM